MFADTLAESMQMLISKTHRFLVCTFSIRCYFKVGPPGAQTELAELVNSRRWFGSGWVECGRHLIA